MTDKPVFKKKLCVIHQEILATWPNKKGTTDTNLWEVTAVDENGEPVTEKLRSFSELELGVLIEYEIEPYEHPQHGKSYTVKKPRSNTTQRVAHLEKLVEDLTDRLSAVEAQLGDVPIPAERGF